MSDIHRDNLAVYRQLEHPWLYVLVQFLLSPGAEKSITQQIQQLLGKPPDAVDILDVGCGPASWLWQVNERPIGLDISSAYTSQFHRTGEPVVTASATDLPFSSNSFDGVWTVGVLHHLPDQLARKAILEMLRVCRLEGYMAILDAVLPEPTWKRPLAYALRRADRGRFVRRQDHAISLLPSPRDWKVQRCTYSLNRLELIIFYAMKKEIIFCG